MSKIGDMRGFLASSIGVTCAAALALPLTPPAAAVNTPAPASAAATAALTDNAATATARRSTAEASGSTQSLPLASLARDRSLGPAAEQGLPRREVRHFSLVGVVWDDPATELHGRVQVRTRAAGTGAWSGWQDVETHNAEHAADPDTAEGASDRVRGATAPLWVGDSDGVEVRVRADAKIPAPHADEPADGHRTATATSPLPAGMRLELVDPGEEATPAAPGTAAPGASVGGASASGTSVRATAPDALARHTSVPVNGPQVLAGYTTGRGNNSAAEPAKALTAVQASAANAELSVPLGATAIPALDRKATERELFALRTGESTKSLRGKPRGKPYIGPRPRIVTRRGWGANEKLREQWFGYTSKVKAAFVHHTATGNGYKCAQAPSVIRGIYRYHVVSMGWRDIGYNFLVDKCGNIYEGRAGGVAKPVMGAHTLGFNTNSMGIAVLGSYSSTKPSAATVKAIARLTAWKLGLHGVNPRAKTYLKSGGGNLYRKGKNVRLNVISGHRDGFATECPGRKLYGKLGTARTTAARYQGR
ncbi:peptidoglycan recognition protein [Streptomyces sp. NBC_00076]|uniref:peptidoglycan recognition protein family protein n=1 Tax=Streptomyces sp. NBC_00076 TaxID=2975642 RepID=UPI00325168CA